MATNIFNNALSLFLNGDISLSSHTIKVALLDNTATPNIDTHDFWNDLQADEIVGTGYTAGGIALSGKTFIVDEANNRFRFDANDVSWTTSTITNARYAIIYRDTGSAATSPVIAVIDFEADKSTSASDFNIVWDSTGVFRIEATDNGNTKVYVESLDDIMDGAIDMVANTLKIALLKDTYNAANASKQDHHAFWSAATWQASTVYTLGSRVRPSTRNGHVYEATIAGTSGGSEPSFPTTDGATVADGSVTWTCREDGDLQFHEVAGTGYAAGGEALANKSVVIDTTNDFAKLTADDVVFEASTITDARHAALYRDTGTPATSQILAWNDFGVNKSTSAADFNINEDTDGWFKLAQAAG